MQWLFYSHWRIIIFCLCTSSSLIEQYCTTSHHMRCSTCLSNNKCCSFPVDEELYSKSCVIENEWSVKFFKNNYSCGEEILVKLQVATLSVLVALEFLYLWQPPSNIPDKAVHSTPGYTVHNKAQNHGRAITLCKTCDKTEAHQPISPSWWQ